MSTWRPLPPRMIERATERRLAGDWPGACAAAGFDAYLNLDEIRSAHGGEVAARLESDLHHLAPDLLRWHLPRQNDGCLRPRLSFPLALYPASHALIARTPNATDGPQRIRLTFQRINRTISGRRDDALLVLRDRWDSRCTAEKLARSGGQTRLPFFTATGERLPEDALGDDTPEGRVERAVLLDDTGRHAEAWSAAGYELIAHPARRIAAFRPIHATLADSVARVLTHIAEAQRLSAPAPPPSRRSLRRHHNRPPLRVADLDLRSGETRIDLRGRSLVLLGRQARLVTNDPDLASIPYIPFAVANRPPEFAALLRGDLHVADLHPLVHAALFPAAAPIPPPPSDSVFLRETIHIHCDNNATHEIQVRDGFVLGHTPAEIDRERLLAALGGDLQGCVAATESWRDPSIRMPRPMQRLRNDFLQYFADADTAAVEAALHQGLDPHMRDEHGRTLLHLLTWLPDTDLLPHLLSAGLDLEALDASGRTPLRTALDFGSRDLVRALLDAGADRTVRAAGWTRRPDLRVL